jgi:hypothetical protein
MKGSFLMQRHETQYLGKVCNPEYVHTVVAIPGASLALGSTAIGLYVALLIGGEIGKTVGALTSAFVARVAYGEVKWLAVDLDLVGQVSVKYTLRQQRALIVAYKT